MILRLLIFIRLVSGSFIAALIFLDYSFAKSVSQSEYNFPFEDPWIASISSAAVGYHGVEFKTIDLELLPERRKVPLLEKRNKVSINVFQQNSKMDLYEHGFDVKKINSAIDRLQLSMKEKKWLIGYSFRLNLRDVVFSSQQVHDQGVLNTEVTRWKQNLRFAEALNIGFVEYLTEIVAPTIPGTATIEQLLRDSGMYEIEDHIKSRNNIYILTNADDFIYRPEDFGYMEDLVGSERFTLYPHGGHVGNLWFSGTEKDLENIMRRP